MKRNADTDLQNIQIAIECDDRVVRGTVETLIVREIAPYWINRAIILEKILKHELEYNTKDWLEKVDKYCDNQNGNLILNKDCCYNCKNDTCTDKCDLTKEECKLREIYLFNCVKCNKFK